MNEEQILTNPQEKYLDWLCLAPSEREPKTKVAMAILLEVDNKTLRRWEKKTIFRDMWEQRVNAIQGSPERTHRLLDTLYERALGGDVKSAALYLQATNRMAPPTIEVKSDRKVSDLSDAELDGMIAAMAAHEKDSRKLKAV